MKGHGCLRHWKAPVCNVSAMFVRAPYFQWWHGEKVAQRSLRSYSAAIRECVRASRSKFVV